jgi:hypothetical protein
MISLKGCRYHKFGTRKKSSKLEGVEIVNNCDLGRIWLNDLLLVQDNNETAPEPFG